MLDTILATVVMTWKYTRADETKKLFSRSTVDIEWDNGKDLTMTATDNNNLKVTHEHDI